MSDFNAKIIEEFRANGGRVGGPFQGANLVLVHHVGAKSGVERVSPLAYLEDGDDLVIAASKGGHPTNPDWYHNLKAHPRVDVEVGTETYQVNAVEAIGTDRHDLWQRLVAIMPGFGDYEAKTTRVIPMFRLQRAA